VNRKLSDLEYRAIYQYIDAGISLSKIARYYQISPARVCQLKFKKKASKSSVFSDVRTEQN
jgi:hypothetical protein